MRWLGHLGYALLAALLVCRATAANAEVELPPLDPKAPILISAQEANRWTQGVYEVWLLRGDCTIRQGYDTARGREAVLWIERNEPTSPEPSRVIAYLEGEVAVDFSRQETKAQLTDQSWLGRFQTAGNIAIDVPRVDGPFEQLPPIYHRAMAKRRPIADGAVHHTQYTQPGAPMPTPADAAPPTSRRVRLFARGDLPLQAEWQVDPVTRQAIGTAGGGVMMVIDGLAPPFGTVDISTDRLVIWTVDVFQNNAQGETVQTGDTPLEVYMEGNIVFRQGPRVIYADRMYYDVRNHVGIVLNADLRSPVPNYQGLLRVRSAVMRQVGEGRYFAEDSFITSSQLGLPGYRLQVGEAYLEDNQIPLINPITGEPVVGPNGEPVVQPQRLATARNNLLFIREIPIFYWPVITTDLNEPTTYIRRLRFKNDNTFGQQVLTNWNGYQLLGLRPIEGTDFDLSLDYLSKRGVGHGGTFTYCRDELFGLTGPASGLIDYWGIQDHGLDNLGAGRNRLLPEKDYRFRLFSQNRALLPNDFQFSAEVLWISDRNFLEEYFLREWETVVDDETTALELKQMRDNWSWSIATTPRLNDFFTQTEWYPRLDHFLLGQSLLGNRLTWYEHTSIGYGRFRTATAPKNFNDRPFIYRPWEALGPFDPGTPLDLAGERVITRQELDLPMQLGWFKVVPYALGELGHWGADLTDNDIQRAYGQLGVRASIPFSRVDPTVESTLWNVHGLAHKVTFSVDASLTDATQNVTEFPLYDPLDDEPIEAFRRRFAGSTFGGAIPAQFDERFYAIRSGMQDWVTSPSMEVVDDLQVVRLGMENRWQTKRGAPGCQRIIDWITLDTGLSLFPNKDNEDYGDSIGLFDYDFHWYVGDRLILLSDGIFDIVNRGATAVSVAAILSRPPRGSIYVGLHYLDGPIHNTILSASYSYQLSPKWISTAAMSVDIAGNGNIGQSLSFTRIGESFLVSLGGAFDATRENFGLHLTIEPRFLPGGRLGRLAGARIPPAGALGLE